MLSFIYQWIDLIWLPLGWFVVRKRHRFMTVAFIATCILTLRTQAELIDSTGYATGFLNLMDSPVLPRGMVVYGIIIMLFLILAYYSPRTKNVIFFAAALSIYILAFCLSLLIMSL